MTSPTKPTTLPLTLTLKPNKKNNKENSFSGHTHPLAADQRTIVSLSSKAVIRNPK